MKEETRQILVTFGLGIPIAALLTYIHFRILRYLNKRKQRERE